MRELYVHVIVFYLLSVSVGTNFTNASFTVKDSFEDTVMKKLSAIEAKLESLQLTCEKKIKSAGCAYSIKDVSETIKGRQFVMAEEQLIEVGDERKVSQIVHNVYAGPPPNEDIIFEFARKLTRSDIKFQVVAALSNEMRSNGDQNPLKLISLAEIVETELSGEQSVSIESRMKAEHVKDSTIEDIKASSMNIFKTAMIANNYQKNAEIESLASAIFHFRPDLSYEVMEQVVDSLFGVVAAGKILDNINSHQHIPLVIAGLKAIFYRFNFAGNLNNEATLDLAKHLVNLKRRENYNATHQDLRADVENIIERLPICARNLYFNTNVCLWNRGRKEYMYAASLEKSYDKDRRNIFTWYTGGIANGATWHVEKIGDYYFFKNVHYINEYLYAVNGGNYSNDLRYVLTWIPGNNTDAQSKWTIELDGDFCYIKSVFNNEYMFASSTKYDAFNTYVFTWIGKTVMRSAYFQWQFRNCDQAL